MFLHVLEGLAGDLHLGEQGLLLLLVVGHLPLQAVHAVLRIRVANICINKNIIVKDSSTVISVSF